MGLAGCLMRSHLVAIAITVVCFVTPNSGDVIQLEVAVNGTIILNCSAGTIDATSAKFLWETSPAHVVKFYEQMELPGRLIQQAIKAVDKQFTDRIVPYQFGSIGIERSTYNDSRLYICIIGSGSNTSETRWNVTVVGNPNKPKAELPTEGVWERSKATIVFTCSSEGSIGKLKYSWERVGGTLPSSRHAVNYTTGQFTIYAADRTDRGDYRCSVDNVAGRETSDVVVLSDVYYTPMTVALIPDPQVGVVTENTSVTLTCSVEDSNPEPRLDIYMRASDDQTEDDSLYESTAADKHVSVIVNITREHNGRSLYCQATWDIGSYPGSPIDSDEVSFDVEFNADKITMPMKPTENNKENTPVTFTCKTGSANPPSDIEWSRSDGEPVYATSNTEAGEYNGNVTISDLHVNATREINALSYTCNIVGNRALHQTQGVNVTFAPSNITLEDASAVRAGQVKTFTCTTKTSNPVSNITWYKDGNQVTETSNKVDKGEYSGSVRVSKLDILTQREDNGKTVSCRAMYDGKLVDDVMDQENLNVTYPHDVTVDASESIIKEGEQIYLTCNSTNGNPDVVTKREWIFTSKYTEQKEVVSSHGETLLLEQISHREAGQYTCEVTNGMGGTNTESVNITVQYAAKQDPDSSQPMTIYTKVGQNAKLIMKSIALPYTADALTVTWSKLEDDQNKTIVDGVKTEVISPEHIQSILSINNIAAKDLTDYYCTVSNGIGDPATFRYTIEQKDKPDKPGDVTIDYFTAKSLNLSWKAGLNGGYRQHFKVHYQGRGENPIGEGDSIPDPGLDKRVSYQIEGLQPDTEYDVWVVAKNDHNGGSQSPSDKITQKTNALPVVSDDSLEAKIVDDVAKLSWKPPQGVYTALKIRSCDTTSNQCKDYDVKPLNITSMEIPVDDSKTYDFFLLVIDNGSELLQPKPFPVVQKADNKAVIIIVVVVLAVLLLAILIVVVVLVRRRRSAHKGDHESSGKRPKAGYRRVQNSPNTSERPPLRISPPLENANENELYNKVNTPRKTSETGMQNGTTKPETANPVYASVNHAKNKSPEKKDEQMKPDEKKDEKPAVEEKPYQNVPKENSPPKEVKPEKEELTYENVPKKKTRPPIPKYENVDDIRMDRMDGNKPVGNGNAPKADTKEVVLDGITYAELDFDKAPPLPTSQPPKIRGADQRTVYEDIDFTKKTPPPVLPKPKKSP